MNDCVKFNENSIEKAKNLSLGIYKNPEKGFEERFATDIFSEHLEGIGLEVKKDIVKTGCIATIDSGKQGNNIAIVAELDAIACSEHPDAGKGGYAHSCGHCFQVGSAYLAASYLVNNIDKITGKINIIGVPSEEYIDIDRKVNLRSNGEITYLGGKQELIAKGYFDDVKIAFFTHNMPPDYMNGKEIIIGGGGIGFVGKKITFRGKGSHAGMYPQRGVSAMSAAVLLQNNINAIRESFADEGIRVHSIITGAGESVNMTPSLASLEMHVRCRDFDTLKYINKRVNNCINAAALSMGCNVDIEEIPGYMPCVDYKNINEYCKETILNYKILEKDQIGFGSISGSANDAGDVSQLLTTLKIATGGIKGSLHGKDFELTDIDKAVVLPAKVIAASILSLSENEGKQASDIYESNKKYLEIGEYRKILDSFSKTTCYNYLDN